MGPVARYPALGGIAAWYLAVLFAAVVFVAAAIGELAVAGVLTVLGFILSAVQRALVLEVAAVGLVRGWSWGGRFLGDTRVIPWGAIEEIRTEWRGRRDFTTLVTEIRSHRAGNIGFSSRMGFGSYRTLVADIAARAPSARWSGLTADLLSPVPPPRGSRLRWWATIAALALLALSAVAAWA